MYDELVKRLRKETVYLPEKFSKNAELLDALMKAADAIEELQADKAALNGTVTNLLEQIKELGKSRWIPVTERFPDTMKDKSVYSGWSAEIAPSDDVLCYLGSEKRQTVAWYSHTYKEWTTVDENIVYKYGEVTHWMPLPQPPKEE